MTTKTEKQIDAAHQLKARLDTHRWDGGIKVIIQGAMRAPVRDGNVTLEASWRADVFYPGARKASFTLVGESPSDVLRQLAGLSEDSW